MEDLQPKKANGPCAPLPEIAHEPYLIPYMHNLAQPQDNPSRIRAAQRPLRLSDCKLIVPHHKCISDISIPVIITDGSENTVALNKAAREGLDATTKPRYFAIGLPSTWRDVEVSSADLAPLNQITRLPQLADIRFSVRRSDGGVTQRETTIILDADVESNKALQRVRMLITQELEGHEARVKRFAWPSTADAGTVKDLLQLHGTDKTFELIEALSHSGPEVPINVLSKAVTALDYFAKDPGGLLHVFLEGVYKPTGEAFIKGSVKHLLEAWGIADTWNSRTANEVAEFIRVDAPALLEVPPRDIINVQNGLLNVITLTLEPHSPTFFSCLQLPVQYDPQASCPAWDKFVTGTFPDDSGQVAWEIVARLMTTDGSIQKVVLLLGEGANGKSTFLAAVLAFLGKYNCSSVALQKLEADRFSVARLVGKMANICADLPSSHLATTSMFKALTGRDSINAERKYRDSFEFTPFAKLVFSANQLPRSDDSSHGFFRRWLIVRFNRVFEAGAKGTLSREELDAQLASPEELSGVLNRALASLPALRKSGFTITASMTDAWNEFRRETDPFSTWLDAHVMDRPDSFVPKRELVDAYAAYCSEHKRTPLTTTAFGLALKRLRPRVEEAQRTVEGKQKTWVYMGLRLETETERQKKRAFYEEYQSKNWGAYDG